jgi:hypothetical protein
MRSRSLLTAGVCSVYFGSAAAGCSHSAKPETQSTPDASGVGSGGSSGEGPGNKVDASVSGSGGARGSDASVTRDAANTSSPPDAATDVEASTPPDAGSPPPVPGEWRVVDGAASSSHVPTGSTVWDIAEAYDGNVNTIWSTDGMVTAEAPAYFSFYFSAVHPVNYVKLGTRLYQGAALGFPISFTISYLGDTGWVVASRYTNFPTPSTQWVTFTLPKTVMTTAIRIDTQELPPDIVSGNYHFQLSEVAAGYAPTPRAGDGG